MSLNTALVDKARKQGKARTGRKVEGTTQYVDTGGGPVFRCRLTLPGSAKNTGAGGEPANSVNMTATLLVGVKDTEGNLLSFNAGDQVEVVSVELGTARWIVGQDPEPLRRRRRMVGWQMNLQRFEQAQVVPERRIEKVRAVADRLNVGDEVSRVRVR